LTKPRFYGIILAGMAGLEPAECRSQSQKLVDLRGVFECRWVPCKTFDSSGKISLFEQKPSNPWIYADKFAKQLLSKFISKSVDFVWFL